MLSGLFLYLGTKNERIFILKLIEVKTFFSNMDYARFCVLHLVFVHVCG